MLAAGAEPLQPLSGASGGESSRILSEAAAPRPAEAALGAAVTSLSPKPGPAGIGGLARYRSSSSGLESLQDSGALPRAVPIVAANVKLLLCWALHSRRCRQGENV